MPVIAVDLAHHRYSITIEPGALARLGELIAPLTASRRSLLVIDQAIIENHGQAAQRSLRAAGFDVHTHCLAADEKDKSLSAASSLYHAMLAAGLDRHGVVIALGGGIVGDIAGFAAATYMRGVPLVQVPTTLLAMVDASIGGKTGVNLHLPDGSLRKNLIGAFWQPLAVIADPQTLLTLDVRHFRCGLAECVKHGMIADASLLQFIHDRTADLLNRDSATLLELISRSAKIKANFVMQDEREQDSRAGRALLNLGHTFGHAFESIAELDLEHGEAVSIGLIAAMHCAVRTNRMQQSEADFVRTLLESLGLPTRLPTLSRETRSRNRAPTPAAKPNATPSVQQIMMAMTHDKKSHLGRLRFILPIGLGSAAIIDDLPRELIEESLQQVT